MTIPEIKGYHVLLTVTKQIPADDADEIQEKKFLHLNYSTSRPIKS